MISVEDILQQELQDHRYLLIEWKDQGVSFMLVETRAIIIEQIKLILRVADSKSKLVIPICVVTF